MNRTLYFAAGSSKLIGWSRLKPLGDVWNSANPWVNYVKKDHNLALLGADIKKKKICSLWRDWNGEITSCPSLKALVLLRGAEKCKIIADKASSIRSFKTDDEDRSRQILEKINKD